MDVERSALEQGIPEGMNKARTQEFQRPVTRIIGVPQLNALEQGFMGESAGMPGKCECLEICDCSVVGDHTHCDGPIV